MLIDRWGRQVTYLRVSVTDRCNLRCVYCMPAEGVRQVPREAVLRYEEIAEVVREAADQGIRFVRLTGGEPLVRPELHRLVRMIAEIKGIEDISLTTNGLLLERQAQALKEAGLNRINLSLDTLQPERFAHITRGGSFETAWRGALAAETAGLFPLKVNVVAMRGVNDDELLNLARLAERGWHVRFIELMPVNNQRCWGDGFPAPQQAFLSIPEIKALLSPLKLEPIQEDGIGNGPARDYRLPASDGRIGFISPLSEHFCQECNRMRLTAEGSFRPCLLFDEEISFIQALRAGEPVLPFLQSAVDAKPAGHELAQHHFPTERTMRQIGG